MNVPSTPPFSARQLLVPPPASSSSSSQAAAAAKNGNNVLSSPVVSNGFATSSPNATANGVVAGFNGSLGARYF